MVWLCCEFQELAIRAPNLCTVARLVHLSLEDRLSDENIRRESALSKLSQILKGLTDSGIYLMRGVHRYQFDDIVTREMVNS